MRLIATLPSHQINLVRNFVIYSKSRQVSLHVEVHADEIELWALDEDTLKETKQAFDEFLKHPKDSKYRVKQETSVTENKQESELVEKPQAFEDLDKIPPVAALPINARLTKIFIAICIFLYVMGIVESLGMRNSGRAMSSMVLTKSQQILIFDYPLTLSLINEFSLNFGDEIKKKESDLSPQAHSLLEKIQDTPYFQGLYKSIVNYKQFNLYWQEKKFGDISRGQIWRLVTPTFLHASILHILFNMLWLFMLGKAVETNLGSLRYLFLTLFLAMATNVLQYLMTGPLFMGYSGVIAGLAGYIWVRQVKAGYEIYPIDRKLFKFLGIFVFGLLGLQVIAFVLQILHILEFNMQIANTAHVSGVILGVIVAKIQPGGIVKK